MPHPEVVRHRVAQNRFRTTPVLGPAGSAQRAQSDVASAAPVTGDGTERGEAFLAPVRRNAARVDARTTYDADAPTALAPGPQYGDGVVAHTAGLRPALGGERRCQRGFLLGQVCPGQHVDGVRRWLVQSCFRGGSLVEPGDDGDGAVDADPVLVATGATRGCDHGPVGPRERQVRLRVAAVDGEN